jgi:predicted aspartyl protease
MSSFFNPNQGLIIARAELEGPSKSINLSLALDTGATYTLISEKMLTIAGYNPSLSPTRVQVTTASGIESVPRMVVTKFAALGHEKTNFPVICHTLPPSANIDGLLGLDFLRGFTLTVDFRTGQIMLK